MVGMERLPARDAEQAVEWLKQTGQTSGFITGFDPDVWPSQTWLLHAMYRNGALLGLGTHADVRQSKIGRGLLEPMIIGDVTLDGATTVTGVALGYVVRPGQQWTRLLWRDYLAETGGQLGSVHEGPPSDLWFPSGSWPVSVAPPPEGSLDEVTWSALLEVLEESTEEDCFAFYSSLPSQKFEAVEVWRGRVRSLRTVLESSGHEFTPSNIWAVDRSWFIYTDYDLLATKVSAPRRLIDRLLAHPDIESKTWPDG